LSYDNAYASWLLIADKFPAANYAFYAPLSSPLKPHGGFSGFATVSQLVAHVMKDKILEPKTHAKAPIGFTEEHFAHSNDTYLIAYDEDYFAFAYDKIKPNKTFHFVASKKCLQLGIGTGGEGSFNKKFMDLVKRLKVIGANFSDWSVPFAIKDFMEKLASNPSFLKSRTHSLQREINSYLGVKEVGKSQSGPVRFRYFQFTPTAFRDNSIDCMQFAYLELRNNGSRVDYSHACASNDGYSPESEGPSNAIEINPTSKFLDFNKKSLIIDFGKDIHMNEYTICTANDCPERDPISWTLSGSNNESDWEILDEQWNYHVPMERYNPLPYFQIK